MGEPLRTGLELTILGMGLVFGLLALLWGLIALLVRLDHSPLHKGEHGGENRGERRHDQGVATRPPLELTPAQLAAIMIAVKLHRAVRRKQAAPAMRSYWPGSLLNASRWVAAGRTRQNHSWPSRRG
jgi:Na+-transporting methylmalonyl-CoA/oxaloacetate decarboxylase gamma subunit